MKRSWLWLLVLGAGLVWVTRGARLPAGMAQAPIDYWFDPATLELLYAPSLTPPRAGMRPASENEKLAYGLASF